MDPYITGINTFNSVKNIICRFQRIMKMGAEQSYSSNLSKNLTKQYVSEYDISDQKSVGRKRTNSTHQKRAKSNTRKNELQRSSSQDNVSEKIQPKNDYPYIVQACPIINNPTYTTYNDNNNNKEELAKHVEKLQSEETSPVVEDFSVSKSHPRYEDRNHIYKTITQTKVKSVKSLRRVFEQQVGTEMEKPLRAVSTKYCSESYLTTSSTTNPDIRPTKSIEDIALEDQGHIDDTCNDTTIEENLPRTRSVENEFQSIEDSLREVEERIREMRGNHEPNTTDYFNDTHSIECINIYLMHEDCENQNTVEDDDFGRIRLGNHDNVDFVEAFNRLGDELVITTASIERKTVTIDNIPENRISIRLSSEFSSEQSLSSVHNSVSSEDEVQTISAANNDVHEDCVYTSATNEDLILSYPEPLLSSDEECSSRTTGNVMNRLLGESDKAVRSETIYDSFQNPRIEKVTNIDTAELAQHATAEILTDKAPVTELSGESDLKKKKDYIIEEIISSEKDYLQHLEMVIYNYMPAFSSDKLPVFLRGSRHIFGNIKKIYSKSQKFYKALKKCDNDHEQVAKTFLAFEELFELYPIYSKNKPTADYFLMGQLKELVQVKEKMLNDRLGLASHLLTPIQRLGKYILLLEQVQKEVVKSENVASGYVHKAITLVRKHMSRGNDFIAIDSIHESPINLTEYGGSFIMREKFCVLKPKKYEAMLFLFENILVFTIVDAKNPELFVYKDSIQLTELGLITYEDLPLSFHLRRFSSSTKGFRGYQEFVVEAKRSRDKKIWTEEIEKRLWEQLVLCKEKQNALQGKQRKKSSAKEISKKNKSKKKIHSSYKSESQNSKGNSVFYHDFGN